MARREVIQGNNKILAAHTWQVDLMVTVAFESGTVVTVSDMRKSDDALLEPLAMSDTIPRPATGGEFFFYPGEGMGLWPGACNPEKVPWRNSFLWANLGRDVLYRACKVWVYFPWIRV